MTKPSPASSTDGSIDHSMKKEELRQGELYKPVILGLAWLDARNHVIRRDIKPVNLLLDIEFLIIRTFWQNMGLTNSKCLHLPSKLFCAGNGLVVEQQGDAVSFIQVLKAAQLLEDAEVKCQ
ncbi:hypothetical protein GW17_00010949 [Ensete ventricosum]|nr:hypothetical protein GW17_00010949 [Ensete ventricosum]